MVRRGFLAVVLAFCFSSAAEAQVQFSITDNLNVPRHMYSFHTYKVSNSVGNVPVNPSGAAISQTRTILYFFRDNQWEVCEYHGANWSLVQYVAGWKYDAEFTITHYPKYIGCPGKFISTVYWVETDGSLHSRDEETLLFTYFQ